MWQEGQLRQIVTRAAVASGRKTFTNTYILRPRVKPETILGIKLVNHRYTGSVKGSEVEFEGQFEVNLWYSYESGSQTSVHKETLTYRDSIPVTNYKGDRLLSDETIDIVLTRDPLVVDSQVSDNGESIELTVELEVNVEVFGNAKLWVRVQDAKVLEEDKKAFEDFDYFVDEDYTDFEDELEEIDHKLPRIKR